MKLKPLVKSWDFAAACVMTLACARLFPHWVKTDFTRDFYGVGITVLSIIFPLFFAAVAIIMASSDDEFVRFLEEKGDYTRLIGSMHFTLVALFLALVVALLLYAYSSYRVSIKVEQQSFIWPTVFTFFFSYALGAAFAATHDAVKYSLYRSAFLRLTRKNPENWQK